jgi:hypothetical protein
MSTDTERHPMDSLDAGSRWVYRLLDLFWAVDEVVKRSDDVPAEIIKAWEAAEAARKRL